MPLGVSTTIGLAEEKDITHARQAGLKLAKIAGYAETDQIRFATAVSELASNAVRYAGGGICTLKIYHDPHQARLVANITDHGPGIPDINAAMRDGFTTGDSLGKGLPGCRRLMDDFHLHSDANGTQIEVALKRALSKSERDAKVTFGIALRPYHQDLFCGDKGGVWANESKALICIVDGLGHGEEAERAAIEAIAFVHDHKDETLANIFHGCDISLRETRGAAMAVAVIDYARGNLHYAAIGNTRAAIINGPATTRIGADTGIIGGGYRSLLIDEYPFTHRSTLVLWTDGLPEFLDFAPYRRTLRVDIQSFADQLADTHGAAEDDAGVVVYQRG